MKKCILIQANGNNERLGKFFKQPKYELYYKEKKIIEHLLFECINAECDLYLALRQNSVPNFTYPSQVKIIWCTQTFNRLDTLSQCFPYLREYDSIVIHDSDVIIKSSVLKLLSSDSLAVGTYKLDGLKYGFINLSPQFKFLAGNEKQKEADHISVGAYSVDFQAFSRYMESPAGESLLHYYNTRSNVNAIYSDSHIALGDIHSYMGKLWSL